MKVRWHGMLGTSHSWAFVSQALARSMVKMDHDINIKSTNGLEHFPEDLKHCLDPGIHEQKPGLILNEQDVKRPYDLELAYTVPYQYPRRFFPETACKMGIWNFESSILPDGWEHYVNSIDYILPSSKFSSDIFINSGIPKEKCIVVPHGVYTDMFNENIPPFELKTQKKVKLLINAIPHARKNLDKAISAYLDAFSGDDDVCLVLKTKFLTPAKDKPFEVDVRNFLNEAFKGRENPPELEVITEFIPDIGSLYTACDAVVCTSSTEGFWLPGLEAMACGTPVISPRFGGQLEYLNDDNSILYDAGEMFAPLEHQYWTHQPKAIVGDVKTETISEAMMTFYKNVKSEKERTKDIIKETVKKFNWDSAAQIIMDLAEDNNKSYKPKKREVVYVVPYGMLGGAEVWVNNVIETLDEKYSAKVVLVQPTPELENLFEGKDIVGLKNNNRFEELKCFLEGTGEIIHFYNSFSVFAILKRSWDEGFRKRVIETHHSNLMWQDSINKIGKRHPIVSGIISVSFNEVENLKKMGNPYVFHLPQQINWSNFTPKNGHLKKTLGVEGNLIGTIGRFSPEKNINMVINCARKMPENHFVIVGEGQQKEIIKKMTKSLKNLHILDFTKDVEDIYNSLDVFMLPSKMEGVPLTILEAMSCGVPVVASDVGNIGEVVIDDVNGYTVKSFNNTNEFVKSINMALENKELLSANALKYIKGYQEINTNISEVYGRLYK